MVVLEPMVMVLCGQEFAGISLCFVLALGSEMLGVVSFGLYFGNLYIKKCI